MNYVDPILKYLSGELSAEEAKSFRDSLNSNEELKQEYEEISAAYELISRQLVEKDELAFREKLLAAMDREIQPSPLTSRRNRRWWLSLVALAASLAILLIIWVKPGGTQSMLSRFYAPDQDPVVLALLQDTRGPSEEGILLYKNKRYGEAMRVLGSLSEKNTRDKAVLLCYLLSAMELDREDEVMDQQGSWDFQFDLLPDQTLGWYVSLALIKNDRLEEARSMLKALKMESGPYQSDAENLLKLLLK